VTKLYNIFIIVLIVFSSNTTISQTTSIPDQNFEQALIDLNIDSDNTINGQVLTSDINTITILDFSNVQTFGLITNLTGIEGFTALEILDFSNYNIFLDNAQAGILSNNTNLKQLIASNPCGDCLNVDISYLDLSGLPNLELVDLSNVALQGLKFNNPNFDLTNLTLNLYNEGVPGVNWTQHICIEVDDPQSASNNQPPYDTWNIIIFDQTTTYGFDSTCNLSINAYQDLNSISIYPNPVKDNLTIDNPKRLPISEIKLYNTNGKLIKTFTTTQNIIDLAGFNKGMYFIELTSDGFKKNFKILKE
jgi:hypothetical protein